MKIIARMFATLALLILFAMGAVVIFGPIVAWFAWGDHAAIGAICLSTATAGMISLLAMAANRASK